MTKIYKNKDGQMFTVDEVHQDWWDKINYDLAKNGIGIWVDGDVVTSGGMSKLFNDIENIIPDDIQIKAARALAKHWCDSTPIKNVEDASDMIESVDGRDDLAVLLNSLLKNDKDFGLRETWVFGKQAIIWVFNINEFDWLGFVKNEHLALPDGSFPDMHVFLDSVALGYFYDVFDGNKSTYVIGSYVDTKFDSNIDKMMKKEFNCHNINFAH